MVFVPVHSLTTILRDLQSVLGAGVGWWGGAASPEHQLSEETRCRPNRMWMFCSDFVPCPGPPTTQRQLPRGSLLRRQRPFAISLKASASIRSLGEKSPHSP